MKMIKFSFNHFLVQRKKIRVPLRFNFPYGICLFFCLMLITRPKNIFCHFLVIRKLHNLLFGIWIWYNFFCVLFCSEGSWIKPVIQKISQRCGIKQSLNTKNKSVPYQPTSGMAFTSNKLEASTCICIYIVPLKSLTSSLEILQMAHHSCKSTWI